MGFTRTNVAASTAAVTNRFVTSANMANGNYTIANASASWAGGFLVTVTHTAVTGNDTLGTITIYGTNMSNQLQTEVITPSAGTTATGTKIFRTVTQATQAGWVINVGNDTIVIGCAAGCYAQDGGGQFERVIVNTTAAATVVISDATGTIATLKASIAEGSYSFGCDVSGYLKVATTSTNDVTLIHSPSIPTYV